jgi:hypothetical protein
MDLLLSLHLLISITIMQELVEDLFGLVLKEQLDVSKVVFEILLVHIMNICNIYIRYRIQLLMFSLLIVPSAYYRH